MKKFFSKNLFFIQLIFFSCLMISSADAQIVEEWAARYNGPNKSKDFGSDIAVDGNGNVYVTGTRKYFITIDGNIVDRTDIATVKYDSHGTELWVRSYSGPADLHDGAVAIAVDAQGNVYVTGDSEKSWNNWDIVTIKYNTNGDELWVARYNGPADGNDESQALAVDAAGNVYVTGARDGNAFRDSTDIVTIKYNAQGVQQALASYEGAANDRDVAYAIHVPGNGYVYITGELTETGPYSDCITIKYNTNLDVQWIRGFDGPEHDDDYAVDLDVDGYGNVYITGGSRKEETNYDLLVVKYDAVGNQKWYKTYHNTERDNGRKIAIDQSNNVIVTGSSLAQTNRDYVTIKYDGNGNEFWNRRFYYDDHSDDIAYDLVLDSKNNIYVTGFSSRDEGLHYATVKYNPTGDRMWVKYYLGPGNGGTATAMTIDAAAHIYITGENLEGNDDFGMGDWAFATIKYATCVLICPADITVNNTTGQCGAIVNYPATTTRGDCGDSLNYSKASGTFFPVGVTTVTVTSPTTGETSSFKITVKDVEAPKITCPANMTVSCAADVPVPVIALVTATDNCSGVTVSHVGDVITNQTCTNRFTLTRTYKATDGAGNTATCSQTITVNDNTPPQIQGLSVSQPSLWPPNHQMRDITLNYTTVDNCVSSLPVSVTITSNEPVNGTADGDTDPDWEVVDIHHIKLRAERASNGNGRIYTITVTVDDGCNPAVSRSTQVIVAHNINDPQTGKPFKIGSTVSFGGTFWDKPGNTHTAKWLLDGSAATNGAVTEPSGNQNGKVSGSYKFTTPGVYKLQMNVTDQTGITSYANTNNDLDAIVVIYDPNGGYSYGGGWFLSQPGSLTTNAAAEGKASYGYSVNYRNAAKPKGETQFEFKVGNFEFNALNFEYLVINGAKAQFTGTGKIIGGQSGIGFIMTVIDGALDGTGVDKIRMKIFNRNTGFVYYDNQPGASEVADPVAAVGTNSSVVIQGTELLTIARDKEQLKEILPVKFDVAVFPNPTNRYFNLRIHSNDLSTKLQMQVYDQQGRLLEKRDNLDAGSLIRLGENYHPGVYIIRIIRGKRYSEVKLVKL
jgi:hypothetical protein